MAVSDGLSGRGALCTEGSLTLEEKRWGGGRGGTEGSGLELNRLFKKKKAKQGSQGNLKKKKSQHILNFQVLGRPPI